MPTLSNKLIIYDSNCKVCSSLKDTVLLLTSISPLKVMAYKDLSPALAIHVDSGKFRNAMALVDISGGATMYGAKAVAYIFSSQYRIVHHLLNFPGTFQIFNVIYNLLAYNRYIIATPASKVQCDCFPDRNAVYRLGYVGITVLISILLTASFGATLSAFFPDVSLVNAAVQMVLIAGTGWIIQILVAILLLRDSAMDYVGHLGSIMVVGLLILVPWMVFHAATGILDLYMPTLSVMISSGVMLWLHAGRIKYLQLSQAWTVSWFVLLQATASSWVYYFHFQ